jgi:hypothetical protein
MVICIIDVGNGSAQFIDNFDKPLQYDSTGMNGWGFETGDGTATMNFKQKNGYASIYVDATSDKLGIWWAYIIHCISKNFNLDLLKQPNYGIRVEARIRCSRAPRRVNLSLNTESSPDDDSNLMEYDIPDTTDWHKISLTIPHFSVSQGNHVFAQLAMMDWGLEQYRVDIDYYKADIVNIDSAGPDLGNPIPYRPPIPPVDSFKYHLPVLQDAMIDLKYPEEKFNEWHMIDNPRKVYLITVNTSQYAIMRWDLKKFKGKKVKGSGLLELSTYAVERAQDNRKDFGMVRVTEILNGDPEWNQESVTLKSLCNGESLTNVINTQMIIDINVKDGKGSKNLITISQPVLQRMIDGRTKGIILRPLGPINASFYSIENNLDSLTAKLHFNIK